MSEGVFQKTTLGMLNEVQAETHAISQRIMFLCREYKKAEESKQNELKSRIAAEISFLRARLTECEKKIASFRANTMSLLFPDI